MVGDGSGKPLGIANASSGVTVVTAATGDATTYTYAGLLNIEFSVPYQYRPNAVWVMSDGAAKNALAMVDGQQRPLWIDGLAPGQPPTLLGYPVYCPLHGQRRHRGDQRARNAGSRSPR